MFGVAPARQVLKLSGPPDVVAAVPYVVGFQPVESLVVIALRGPRQEVLHTLRVDLSDVAEVVRRQLPDQPVHPRAIAATLKRNGAQAALVVVLTEQPAEPDEVMAGRALVLELRDELSDVDIPVRDAMLVQDGRWFSYLCHNPDCCPAEGTPVTGPAEDRVLAELALAGEAPQPGGREDIVARVAADTTIRSAAVEAAVDALLDSGEAQGQWDDRPAGTIAHLRGAFQAVRGGSPLEPETVARCLVGLPAFAVRDACVHPWDGEDGDAALELWCSLTRLAPEGLVAAPACLVAFVALCQGQGALANAAIDRALDDWPDYSWAHLLRHAAAHGVPPALMRRIADETRGDLGYSVLDDEPAEAVDCADAELEAG
jgi:hypothetical protein